MKHGIIGTMAIAVVLVCSSAGLAADGKSAPTDQASKTTKSATGKKIATVEPIDINSASKAKLKTLPGIGDAQADRIIAGRPYGSKSWLVTHEIITGVHYEQIKDLIIARQK